MIKPAYATLKRLLAAGERSPRNYAGVLAVWDKDLTRWAWTDGFSLIGQGEHQTGKPEYTINSKHVKVSEAKGSNPLTLHEDVRAPNVSYPHIGPPVTEIKPALTLTVNTEYMLRAVESLKKLSMGDRITLELSDDRIKLRTPDAWAILCTIEEKS